MLYVNMNISCIMVYARKVEEPNSKRKTRDFKRARSFYGGSSKNKLEKKHKHRFKKRVSNQVPSKFPRYSGDRVSNPKFEKGKGTNSPNEKTTCQKCG